MLYETVMGWMAAQRNEGIAIGERQGIAIGEQRGIAIGVREKAVQTARRALERGFAPEVVSEITGLPVDEVEALL